jgi:hypothetical protein
MLRLLGYGVRYDPNDTRLHDSRDCALAALQVRMHEKVMSSERRLAEAIDDLRIVEDFIDA